MDLEKELQERIKTREYRKRQFDRIKSMPSKYCPTIKITMPNKTWTNCMNITYEELTKICEILTK